MRETGEISFPLRLAQQINRKLFYKSVDVESILHVVAGRDKDGKVYNLKTECL